MRRGVISAPSKPMIRSCPTAAPGIPALSLIACGGQISFFNSASKFNASRGVSRFKSTSRNLSSTGCDRGVKIVNCAGSGLAPGDKMSRGLLLRELMFGQHFARPFNDLVGQSRQLGDFDAVAAISRAGLDLTQEDDASASLFHRRRDNSSLPKAVRPVRSVRNSGSQIRVFARTRACRYSTAAQAIAKPS